MRQPQHVNHCRLLLSLRRLRPCRKQLLDQSKVAADETKPKQRPDSQPSGSVEEVDGNSRWPMLWDHGDRVVIDNKGKFRQIGRSLPSPLQPSGSSPFELSALRIVPFNRFNVRTVTITAMCSTGAQVPFSMSVVEEAFLQINNGPGPLITVFGSSGNSAEGAD